MPPKSTVQVADTSLPSAPARASVIESAVSPHEHIRAAEMLRSIIGGGARTTADQLHLSAPLTQFATAYKNTHFVADDVAPLITVDALSGPFTKRPRIDQVNLAFDDLATPKGVTNMPPSSATYGTYQLEGRSLMDVVDRVSMSAITGALDPKQIATQLLMQRILLKHEYRVAQVMQTAANYASTNTFVAGTAKGGAAAKWSDGTSGDPITDILAAKELLPYSGDEVETVAWCSDVVWNALRRHPALLGLKGTTEGMVKEDAFCEYFGIDKLIASRLQYSASNYGQTQTISRMWGTTVFGLAIRPKNPVSTDQTMFAASFRHSSGLVVLEWNDPKVGLLGGDYVKISHLTQAANVVQNDAAVLITTVL